MWLIQESVAPSEMEPATCFLHSVFLKGADELQYNPVYWVSAGTVVCGPGSEVFADTAMYPVLRGRKQKTWGYQCGFSSAHLWIKPFL